MTSIRMFPFKNRLKRVKWAFLDAQSWWARRRFGLHRGLEQHDLSTYQVYPRGMNFDMDFLTQHAGRYPKWISKRSTHVASIGSCFAVEVKRYLCENDFQFVSTEDSWAGSAGWGRVYTIKNMLQIFQYTFDSFRPSVRFIRTEEGVLDPYRDQVAYASETEAEKGIAEHRRQSRVALTSCDVLIVTPGQNETWMDTQEGCAWARKPPLEVLKRYGPDRFKVKRFSLEENRDYLQQSLELLWRHNPDLKIILTVSPVPSSATFEDANVGLRSFENKAILLLAVKDVAERYPKHTAYFPSFEMALLTNHTNFQPDNRHVRPDVIERIMGCFKKNFVVNIEDRNDSKM